MSIDLDIPVLKNEYEILHLIVHRNNNQHRQAKWWKYVGVVHRNVRKLINIRQPRPAGNIESRRRHNHRKKKSWNKEAQGIQSERKDSVKSKKSATTAKIAERSRWEKHLLIIAENISEISADTNSRNGSSPIKKHKSSDSPPADFNHVRCAEYLVYKVIPKAHNAFRRMIARRQYIPLAMVLIATFARIWKVLRQDTRIFRPIKERGKIKNKSESVDIGQIIKRDEMSSTTEGFDLSDEFLSEAEDRGLDSSSEEELENEDSGLKIYDDDDGDDRLHSTQNQELLSGAPLSSSVNGLASITKESSVIEELKFF
ncbi:uncharacterized protein V2V93DRAFT_254740 [Kockiozyma suomiensis]|uniref:uncharacterized protein n=1 Tax=Kockiozyma suomiensis TaxID=1337062 RepID=UPI00334364CD